MVEDGELNAMIRSALEEGGAFAFRMPKKRRAVRYWAPTLLAAALTLVAAFRVTFQGARTEVADAIALLSAADEIELEEVSSPEELLLAWQEAPYRYLLSE